MIIKTKVCELLSRDRQTRLHNCSQFVKASDHLDTDTMHPAGNAWTYGHMAGRANFRSGSGFADQGVHASGGTTVESVRGVKVGFRP